MAHKYDIKNIHKLDNEKRRKILSPLEVLVDIGLREGDIMADIGCGTGYFTFPESLFEPWITNLLKICYLRHFYVKINISSCFN